MADLKVGGRHVEEGRKPKLEHRQRERERLEGEQ